MTRRHEFFYLVIVWTAFLLLLSACALLPTKAVVESTKKDFDNFQNAHPAEVFAPTIDQRTKDCLEAYRVHRKLPNGLHYGDSVRGYSLSNKTPAEVKADMRNLNCLFKEDVIREPVMNQPKLHQNHTIPLWIFMCPDGGVVRVKPKGDPTNELRPQIHGSKSLRYPYDAKFENYSDEVVKIDSEGWAVPKSRKDLDPLYLVTGWGADAHADLKESP